MSVEINGTESNSIKMHPVSTSPTTGTKQGIIGTLYVYKNDPTAVRKGINVSNVIYPQGGYLPLLADNNYQDRKHDNVSYKYDSRVDHGSRRMHKSSFSLMHGEHNATNRSDFVPKNKTDFKGYQLRPDSLPSPALDQFRTQNFDIGECSTERNFSTSYQNQFYRMCDDQKLQIDKVNRSKMYNRQSTIKQDLIQDSNEPSYWTQYNRTHNLLGAKRGVGIAREYPNRISYNVITGEENKQPSWIATQRYNRVSGDFALNAERVNDKSSILG